MNRHFIIALVLPVLTSLASAAPAASQPHTGDTAALLRTIHEGHYAARSNACFELGKMGPAARSAVPELVSLLRNRWRADRGQAAGALVRIAPDDPAAIAALSDSAADSAPDVREQLAWAIDDLSPPRKWALPVLIRLIKDKYDPAASQAIDALANFGPDAAVAIPELTEIVASKESKVRGSAARALARLGPAGKPAVPALISMLHSEDQSDRRSAADALGRFGPAALTAVPELIKATQDEQPLVRVSAALALGRLGQDPAGIAAFAAPVTAAGQPVRTAFMLGQSLIKDPLDRDGMIKLLQAKKTSDRVIASLIEDAVREGGESSLPGLTAALDSPIPEMRSAAAFALARLALDNATRNCPGAALTIRALIAHVNEPDQQARNGVFTALRGFGSPLSLPVLLACLNDKSENTRTWAAVALWGIRADDHDIRLATAALIKALKDPAPNVRMMAAATLGEYGPRAKDAVPMLMERLEDRATLQPSTQPASRPGTQPEGPMIEESRHLARHMDVRLKAVEALGKIGPDARAAVPGISAQLADKEPNHRKTALRALERIGPAASAAVPRIVPLLADAQCRKNAAMALAGLGGKGAAVLVEALRKPREGTPEWDTSYELGVAGRLAVPVMVQALKDPDPKLRRQIVDALAANGACAEAAVPALLAMVKEDKETLRKEATKALWKIGPATIPAFVELLDSNDVGLVELAALSLRDHGPRAAAGIPGLIKALDSRGAEARREAVKTLGAIGPAARPALPKLRAMKAADIDDAHEITSAVASIEGAPATQEAPKGPKSPK